MHICICMCMCMCSRSVFSFRPMLGTFIQNLDWFPFFGSDPFQSLVCKGLQKFLHLGSFASLWCEGAPHKNWPLRGAKLAVLLVFAHLPSASPAPPFPACCSLLIRVPDLVVFPLTTFLRVTGTLQFLGHQLPYQLPWEPHSPHDLGIPCFHKYRHSSSIMNKDPGSNIS